MKSLIFTLSLLCSLVSNSQYIGVRARYAESRVVLNVDPLLPPSRENRLILSFYHVTVSGEFIPVSMSNYIIYVEKEGLQYMSYLDSNGNNYPGYLWTAPRVVAYFGTYAPNAIDCNPNITTAYTVNGHELDCGFIRVSYWEEDLSNSTTVAERFSAPNVCLHYYQAGEQYELAPGNVNFTWPGMPDPPYKYYNFLCAASPLQLAIRGLLQQDTGSSVVLPIKLVNERGTVLANCNRKIEWTNMTESSMQRYEVERSVDGVVFSTIATVLPRSNIGNREDYIYLDTASINAERIYYRIKCIESASLPFYSVTIPLKNCFTQKGPKLSIYPNPARDGRFYLNVTDLPAGDYTIYIHNGASQVVRLSTIQHPGGVLNKLYELSYKAPGLYTVTLKSTDLSLSQKVLINN